MSKLDSEEIRHRNAAGECYSHSVTGESFEVLEGGEAVYLTPSEARSLLVNLDGCPRMQAFSDLRPDNKDGWFTGRDCSSAYAKLLPLAKKAALKPRKP